MVPQQSYFHEFNSVGIVHNILRKKKTLNFVQLFVPRMNSVFVRNKQRHQHFSEFSRFAISRQNEIPTKIECVCKCAIEVMESEKIKDNALKSR